MKTISFVLLAFLLSGCDSIGSSSSGRGLIIEGSEVFQENVNKALKLYRADCVYKIKPSKGRFSVYVGGVAYMDAGISDVQILAGKIAHEDYHCEDRTPRVHGQSPRDFRIQRELNAFKYEADIYRQMGRGDLAAHIQSLDGTHCLNTTPKSLL